MGILRLLLALSVFFCHAGAIHGWTLAGGDAAVQTFFMISGFYVYMILNGKYVGPKGVRTFYLNRFLRLYPAYWIVLAFTLLTPWMGLSPKMGESPLFYWADWLPHMHWKALGASVLLNFGILFQDVLHYLRFDFADGAFHLGNYGWWVTGAGWKLLLIPQSWSLGIELSFYLLAPWILRKGPVPIATVAVASLFLRYALYHHGFNQDPWLIRFFPNELFFFCAGALACHFYQTRVADIEISPYLQKGALALVWLATIGFQFVPVFQYWSNAWAYYALVLVSLPLIFKATARNPLDRFVGELSYPLYICHFTLVRLVRARLGTLDTEGILEVLALSLVFSYFLIRVTRPLENLRAENANALRGAAPRKSGRAPRKRKRLARSPARKREPVALGGRRRYN